MFVHESCSWSHYCLHTKVVYGVTIVCTRKLSYCLYMYTKVVLGITLYKKIVHGVTTKLCTRKLSIEPLHSFVHKSFPWSFSLQNFLYMKNVHVVTTQRWTRNLSLDSLENFCTPKLSLESIQNFVHESCPWSHYRTLYMKIVHGVITERCTIK